MDGGSGGTASDISAGISGGRAASSGGAATSGAGSPEVRGEGAAGSAGTTPGEAGAVAGTAGQIANAAGSSGNTAGGGGTAAPASEHRPEGVATCYSSLSSAHPATLGFWAVFRAGAFGERAAATAALADAARAYPDEEEFALLHGLASLWRVAEPAAGEEADIVGFLDAVSMAQSELERAYELCPTDHRIPAWLGPVMVNAGRAIGDEAAVEGGLTVLQRGIDHYPAFVLFSKLLVFADRPKTDPDFQKALDAVTDNIAACMPSDPACSNHAFVSHNLEGAAVFLGDVLAKAGDREAARKTYTDAMAVAEYGDWNYQDVLEARLATLDARSGAFDTPDTADDPESAWNSTQQCSICHRD